MVKKKLGIDKKSKDLISYLKEKKKFSYYAKFRTCICIFLKYEKNIIRQNLKSVCKMGI